MTKVDVDAALKVLNFAIYHKELAEMEEREQEREKEVERKRKADHSGVDDRSDHGRTSTTEGWVLDSFDFVFEDMHCSFLIVYYCA